MTKRTPATRVTRTTAETSTALARLRALWLGTAARYTGLALAALFISALLNQSLTMSVNTIRFFLFLPFAALLTLAAWVRRADKLSSGARICLHPLLTLGGFYLCVYLPYQIKSKPSGQQVLMLVLLAVLLYGIGMTVYLLCTRRARTVAQEAVPYERQFKQRND